MISKILSITSGKLLKPSGKVKGIVVSNSKGEIVVKLADSTINLSVTDNDLKTGDAVSVSFLKDTVNLKKIVHNPGSTKDLIKIESSDVIRNILSQIEQVKSLDNENLQKTLENLSNNIRNRELQISLLEKSITFLEEENESIKQQTGNRNREIDKLISLLISLKKSLPDFKRDEFIIKDTNIKIDAEGTYEKELTIKNTVEEVKTFFNEKRIPLDLLKSISSKSGPYMIIVTPGGDTKEAIIDIYPEKAQMEGVKNLQKSFFDSFQLKNISSEILVDMLKDSESVKAEHLVKLDNLFRLMDTQKAPAPIKDNVMKLFLLQLAAIVDANEIENEHLKAKLAPLVDESLSQQLVSISKDQEVQKLDPQFKKLLNMISTVAEGNDKKDIIPILFKLSGLSNENEVLKFIKSNTEKPEEIKNSADIKSLISEILKAVDNIKSSEMPEKSNSVVLDVKTSGQTTEKIGSELVKYLNEEIARYSEVKRQVELLVNKLDVFQQSQPKIFSPEIQNDIELVKPGALAELDNILKSADTTEATGTKVVIKDALVQIFIQQINNILPDSDILKEKIAPEEILDSLKPIVKENKKLSEILKHLFQVLKKIDSYPLLSIAPSLAIQSSVKNENMDLISEILSQMLTLKKSSVSENNNIQKVLINLAKNIKSEQVSISLLDSSIKILKKENEIIKTAIGEENKDIRKLISALSSLKENLNVDTKGETPILSNNVKFDVSGEFKSLLTIKNNLQELRAFFNRNELPEDILKSISTKNGPYMISVNPETSNEKATVNIYSEKEQIAGIAYLQKTFFKSGKFINSSPKGILEFLKNVETIKPESIMNLDNVFKSAEASNSKIALREELIKQLFPQFSTAVLNEDTVKQKLLPIINEKLSQQLLDLIKNTDIKKLDPQIEKILNELTSVINNENRKSIVPALFKLAELSADKEMFGLSDKMSLTSNAFDEKDNLKSVLLKMLHLIDKEESRGGIENRGRSLQDTVTDSNRSLNDEQAKLSNVKKQVLQIIEKIEAFQVLAKSTPSPDGKSQLIVLPVNMGGEWVDMQLRITHRKQKQTQNRDKKRISVALNIELSAIGEVSAEIEYFKNREIALNVTLSNKRFVEWFENKRTEIEEGLRILDLNVIKLNFRSSKSFIKTKTVSHKKANSNFDIVG